jgi:light-regulated signal transduction histidine kinase (bacteriophytochrome)
VRSYLAVPIISRTGDVLGGLFFGHAEKARFSEQVEQLVVGVAAQAAVALDNARLFAQARAQEELRASNEALRKANAELEEFAYVASHDLQEPLRMVNIYTQLLLKRSGAEGDPETGEVARHITGGVRRMEGLIHDLLSYSRIVHAEQPDASPADLNDSLRQALSILEERIRENEAAVTFKPLPTVRGDSAQLAQVFQNLVSNAIKYRKSGETPRVHIAAESRNGDWVISVADNGIGFDAKYAERIFGLFRRLHRDEYPGTGLGLAICRRILERHGGRIWAEAAEGRGATFYFALPGEK